MYPPCLSGVIYNYMPRGDPHTYMFKGATKLDA